MVLLLLFVPPGGFRGRHLLSSLTRSPDTRIRFAVLAPANAGDDLLNAAPVAPRGVLRIPATPETVVPLRPFTAGPPADSSVESSHGVPGSPGLVPSLQSGLLWDRRAGPPVRVGRTNAELTDSAAKAAIQHYLDSLAALPNGGRVLPPTWKGTIGGREYGLDAMWITVAGVKIPSLLLGFVPLPAAGNESKALDKTGQMRAEDYRMAMPRDAIAEDQREEIRKIRERQEAERDLNRKQAVEP